MLPEDTLAGLEVFLPANLVVQNIHKPGGALKSGMQIKWDWNRLLNKRLNRHISEDVLWGQVCDLYDQSKC